MSALVAEAMQEPEKCPECKGEGWHMAPMDSVWPDWLCWKACGHCNPDGTKQDPPAISYAEFVRRKHGGAG